MKKHDKELDQFEDGQLSQQEYDKILSHSLEEVYDKGYFLGMDIAVERINSANKSTTRGEIFDKVLADIRTDTIKEIIEIEENKRIRKQLYDAGFKLPYDYCTIGSKFPTLSELIEACGEGFYGLEKTTDGTNMWEAQTIKITPLVYLGKTPEEAVAKLWLELNKEDKLK